MKLGLESLTHVDQKSSISMAAFYRAEVDMLESYIGIESMVGQLDNTIETRENISHIKATVEAHGIDNGLIALFGNELSGIAPTFKSKDAKGVTVALEGVLKDAGTAVIDWIKKIWAKIKEFFAKTFSATGLALKIYEKELDRVQKLGGGAAYKGSLKSEKKVPYYYKPETMSIRLKMAAKSFELAEKIENEIGSGKWAGNASYETINTYVEQFAKEGKDDKQPDFVTTVVGTTTQAFAGYRKNLTEYKAVINKYKALPGKIRSHKISKLEVTEGAIGDPKKMSSAASKCISSGMRYIVRDLHGSISVLRNIGPAKKK